MILDSSIHFRRFFVGWITVGVCSLKDFRQTRHLWIQPMVGWITCPNDLQQRLSDPTSVDGALGRCASVKGWWEEGVDLKDVNPGRLTWNMSSWRPGRSLSFLNG